MDLCNEAIRDVKKAEIANGNLDSHDTYNAAWHCWYIFRYKVLNKRTKEYFQKDSDRIFFPYRSVRKVQEGTGKVEFVEQPMVPGYIFVNAKLKDAIALGKEVDLNPWKKRLEEIDTTVTAITPSERKALEEKQYYSIKDDVMRQFIRAVDISDKDVKILDANSIDLEKDDFVEIIAGQYAGYKGYLKSVNGSNGGLVIVPLEDDDSQVLKTNCILSYGIIANSSEVAILSFAKGSRRATDLLNHASSVVDTIMEDYVTGRIITVQQTSRLMGYAKRFGKVELERPIQRERLALLLYRIYTILELSDESEAIRSKIETEILPGCKSRIEKACARDKASAETTYKKYEEKLLQTDEANKKRIKAG